jgi:hypothetical protein
MRSNRDNPEIVEKLTILFGVAISEIIAANCPIFPTRQEIKKSLAIVVNRLAPPHRAGRHQESYISAAVALREQGLIWSRVYASVLENYSNLDSNARSMAQIRLRQAVRNRLKSQQTNLQADSFV